MNSCLLLKESPHPIVFSMDSLKLCMLALRACDWSCLEKLVSPINVLLSNIPLKSVSCRNDLFLWLTQSYYIYYIRCRGLDSQRKLDFQSASWKPNSIVPLTLDFSAVRSPNQIPVEQCHCRAYISHQGGTRSCMFWPCQLSTYQGWKISRKTFLAISVWI